MSERKDPMARRRTVAAGKLQQSPATIAQIASLAGVSKMTVSRVLRGDGSFSPLARERVMDAVQQTGYVHNRLAGSLASARSTLVAVIVPTLSNIAFTEVLSGISNVLGPAGLQAVLGVTEYDQLNEEKLVETMLSWRPCALVVTGLEHRERTRSMLASASVPVVEVMDTDGEVIDLGVGLSHRAAGSAMAEHFISRGYRNIAFAGARLQIDLRAGKRLEGFRDRLRRDHIELVAMDTPESDESLDFGERALIRLRDKVAELDAIFFANDDSAIGAVFHCMRTELKLRADISIAGFNGLALGQRLPIQLTTIRSPRYQMGEEAARLLLNRLAGDSDRICVDTGFELIVGATA